MQSRGVGGGWGHVDGSTNQASVEDTSWREEPISPITHLRNPGSWRSIWGVEDRLCEFLLHWKVEQLFYWLVDLLNLWVACLVGGHVCVFVCVKAAGMSPPRWFLSNLSYKPHAEAQLSLLCLCRTEPFLWTTQTSRPSLVPHGWRKPRTNLQIKLDTCNSTQRSSIRTKSSQCVMLTHLMLYSTSVLDITMYFNINTVWFPRHHQNLNTKYLLDYKS